MKEAAAPNMGELGTLPSMSWTAHQAGGFRKEDFLGKDERRWGWQPVAVAGKDK